MRIPRSHIFKRDRLDRTGCDVLFAISAACPSFLLEILAPSDVEFVAIGMKLDNKSMFIYCSSAPNADVSIYMKHAALVRDVIQPSKSLDMAIAIGEVDFSHITWCLSEIFCYWVPIIASDRANMFFYEI